MNVWICGKPDPKTEKAIAILLKTLKKIKKEKPDAT